MTKILIVGIGGVGGFFGGLLAKAFAGSKDVSVNFMARGKHLQAIQSRGLQVLSLDGEFTAHPALASDEPAAFGPVDYVILATKSYDLEDTVQHLRPCIRTSTVFIPLLNGVDTHARIQKLFPDNLVAEGCAYIISRLTAPGTIENLSAIKKLYFGVQDVQDERLTHLQNLFEQAGIASTCSTTILQTIWEKFVFISSTATATSYYDKTFGEIRDDEAYSKGLKALIGEVSSLAAAKGIALPEDSMERTLSVFNRTPSATTTSMHSDYRSAKGSTEVESLTGYVLKEAEKYGLSLPIYEKMYAKLATPAH